MTSPRAPRLPRAGETSRYEGSSAPGYVGAAFVYDDGDGAARVAVSLDYPPSGSGLGAACEISTCTTLADGNRVAIYQGNGHPGDPSIPGKDWELKLQRSDGVVVSITEWNSVQEKSSPQTRPSPPFSIDELLTWAGSGSWQVRPH